MFYWRAWLLSDADGAWNDLDLVACGMTVSVLASILPIN